MSKGLILLNKDYSISYCKMKNLPMVKSKENCMGYASDTWK